MKELNTKNLKYNILTVYEQFNWKLIPTLIASITLLIASIGLAYSCSDLKDEVFGFSKFTWFLIAIVSGLISYITINTQTGFCHLSVGTHAKCQRFSSLKRRTDIKHLIKSMSLRRVCRIIV